MAERKFRFVSPGIFINEVDNSQLPNDLPDVGPIIIGRADYGPGMRPIRVNSPSEFIEFYGNPIPGGRGDDVWRDGNYTGPTYGAYAAMAYLRAGVGPVNYVRLLGSQSPTATAGQEAGWMAGAATPSTTLANNDGAFGLFVFPSASSDMRTIDIGDGRLAAVFYGDGAAFELSGTNIAAAVDMGTLGLIKSTATGPEFKMVISDTTGATAATAANCIDTTGAAAEGADTIISINVPETVGGASGNAVLIRCDIGETTNPAEGADQIAIGTSGKTDAEIAALIIKAINGTADDLIDFASSGNGQTGVQGVTATAGTTSSTHITLTMDIPGEQGNVAAVLANNSGEAVVDVTDFTGGVDDATTHTTSFNFDRNSSKYIRKVFNTNPQLLNGRATTHTDAAEVKNLASKYFLGETFERFAITDPAISGDAYAIVVPLAQDTTAANNYSYKRRGFSDGKTGIVFSQNVAANYTGFDAQVNTQNLFEFRALNHAEWASKNLKISITDVKASKNDVNAYGTFTVQVRLASDSDNAPQIVEQFTGCNLNPASENYVGKKIGDKYVEYDTTQRRLRQYGEFENQSKYIYIIMNSVVADGNADPSLLPFGFYGPPKPHDFTIVSGSVHTFDSGSAPAAGDPSTGGTALTTFATGSSAIQPIATRPDGLDTLAANTFLATPTGTTLLTASFLFPSIPLRTNAIDGGLSDPTKAYFGIQPTINSTSTRFDPGYADYVRPAPGSSDTFTAGGAFENSFIFTLDDISGSAGVHSSGSSAQSAAANKSLNAANGTFTSVLDNGFNRFTMPLWGGHDGVDIGEQEPFNNVAIGASSTEDSSYAYYTVKRAIDTVSDPEFVEANIISVPGVTQPLVTDQLLSVAENRADCLAVIDIENVYTPKTESTLSYQNRLGSVSTAVSSLENRRINTSYGCTFYPWVRIRDDISNATLWAPPSVTAIGTFASSEARSELWFAPAGFTRGGLSTGAGGFGVLSTTERLRREDRDDLYEVNINPIATFPSEGIVIFGQKTLQVTPSALDRVNVRRLLIFLKKRISRIAAGILFDQNVNTTWLRFKTEADKFLGSVQARLGLTEFRVVLDNTTTTSDLVDRNILYAKIFLKPARAIEFIAIDFVITRSGASFDD
jgi:phage tail sheath protein FI